MGASRKQATLIAGKSGGKVAARRGWRQRDSVLALP